MLLKSICYVLLITVSACGVSSPQRHVQESAVKGEPQKKNLLFVMLEALAKIPEMTSLKEVWAHAKKVKMELQEVPLEEVKSWATDALYFNHGRFSFEFLRLLGANINDIRKDNRYIERSYFLSKVLSEEWDVVDRLLSVNVDLDYDAFKAVGQLLVKGQLALLKKVVSLKPQLIRHAVVGDFYLIQAAMMSKKEEVLRWILGFEAVRKDLTRPAADNGDYPLFSALNERQVDFAKILIEHGVDSTEFVNGREESALEILENYSSETLKYMAEKRYMKIIMTEGVRLRNVRGY